MTDKIDDEFERIFKEFLKKILKDNNLWRVFESYGLPRPSEKEIDDLVKMMSNIKFLGFSITIGPDGKPVFKEIKPEEFFRINNFLRITSGTPLLEEHQRITDNRETRSNQQVFIDIFETDKGVEILIETNDPEKVSITTSDNGRKIIVTIDDKKYEYESPVPVDDKPLSKKYKNGILEIILPVKK